MPKTMSLRFSSKRRGTKKNLGGGGGEGGGGGWVGLGGSGWM